MRWHAHTHGYATWAGWRSPCATSKSKRPALREDRILKERLQISSKVRKVPIVFSVMIYVLFSLLFSIVVMAARTLGDDVFIVLRRDDVCMKEQSCPGHGLWEQCDHGPSGGKGEGGIVLNLPPARNRQTALVWVRPHCVTVLWVLLQAAKRAAVMCFQHILSHVWVSNFPNVLLKCWVTLYNNWTLFYNVLVNS